ncbi:PTS cellobiose transporter subunit IIC [Bacteroidia bacterium]|nr:PTS cellobiose transporter subunit IIC [Bacteroidia bacterium]
MLKRTYFYIGKQASFNEELIEAKNRLQPYYNANTLVGISFFISADEDTGYFIIRTAIIDFCKGHFGNLPVSIIAQPAGKGIAVEVWTHDTCTNLQHKRVYGLNYTTYEDAWGKALWGLGAATADTALSFREQADYAFELMKGVLAAEGYTFDDIVRQWNYIPRILTTSLENGHCYQNYQLFNDIRQYYYGIYKRNSIYPAATGIGTEAGVVSLDFFAVKKNEATRITGIANPKQVNAYSYGQEVLVGSPIQANELKKAPLFERAKYIGTNEEALVFISGTASILGELTIGINDVALQNRTTIANVTELTSQANCSNYSYLRVYVKRPEDTDTIREICTQRYGNIPVLYVKADVCRDNLLVEIEGEAI